MGVPEVKGEHVGFVFLAADRALNDYVLTVVIEIFIDDRPKHFCEHEFADEP